MDRTGWAILSAMVAGICFGYAFGPMFDPATPRPKATLAEFFEDDLKGGGRPVTNEEKVKFGQLPQITDPSKVNIITPKGAEWHRPTKKAESCVDGWRLLLLSFDGFQQPIGVWAVNEAGQPKPCKE